MATRQPRARKEKSKVASGLLEALKFISVAQHSDGPGVKPYQTHCRIAEGTVIGFDGGIACGHLIDESLNVCPHTQMLIAALSKCEQEITITELDNGKLSIKSGKFKATVPCLPFGDLQALEPDQPIATLTDSIKTALGACLPLVGDSLPDAFMCGVLLQAGTAVSTNRHVIIEAWHGVDLPPILIPKVAAQAIAKSSKTLKAFGFSENSATFFFEDDSFIRTQLFKNEFPPGYKSILDIESNPFPIPGGFYEALESITPFLTESKQVFFVDGKICTHLNPNEGANYEVEGLTNLLGFNAEYLKIIRPHAHRMHFKANDRNLTLFFGENVRGGIMGLNVGA